MVAFLSASWDAKLYFLSLTVDVKERPWITKSYFAFADKTSNSTYKHNCLHRDRLISYWALPWKRKLCFESILAEPQFRRPSFSVPLDALARGQLKASSKMQIRFGTGFALDLLRTRYLVASFPILSTKVEMYSQGLSELSSKS